MVTPEEIIEFLHAGKYRFRCGGTHMDEAGLSAYLVRSRRTLRYWRATGEGPLYADVGGIVYPIKEVAGWLSNGGNRKKDRQKAAETGK